jgi:hypothetical protein
VQTCAEDREDKQLKLHVASRVELTRLLASQPDVVEPLSS